ncbi:MAG: sigma-70 region 4 domain-containing protein, partial [Gemmataceae bacterium]|nr:sigma-70 region 4 domain-containing protein [Gemmataceae bacterium]
ALPEDERQLFELHYLCDISQADIARQFGLEPRAVSYTWSKAKAKLVKYL